MTLFVLSLPPQVEGLRSYSMKSNGIKLDAETFHLMVKAEELHSNLANKTMGSCFLKSVNKGIKLLEAL